MSTVTNSAPAASPASVPVLRAATDHDAPRLVELAAELGYGVELADVPRRLAAMRSAGHEVLVAAVYDEVIGWVQVGGTPSLVDATAARVLGLVVAEGWRGLGIGRRLVEAAEQWAVDRGLTQVVVNSNVLRGGAHAFYPALGFVCKKTQHVYAKTLDRAPGNAEASST